VMTPSKDLRAITDLSRVVLVDDNPTRVFQPANLRLVRKFKADRHCADFESDFDAQGGTLAQVWREIRDSLEYVNVHRPGQVSFAEAFLPYTQTGGLARRWLIESAGMSDWEATEYVRSKPSIVDQKF
jgi:hypothetical protein